MYKLKKNSIILTFHLELVDKKISWNGHGNSPNIVNSDCSFNFIAFGDCISIFNTFRF